MVYRVYVTDALRMMTENTSRFSGGGYVKERYFDMIRPQKEETRTAKEIIEHLKAGLRGET
jgi:hypothetical protein